MPSPRAAAAVAAICLALSGCGTSGTPPLAPATKQRLRATLQTIRRAVSQDDPGRVRSALQALNAQVLALRRAGALNAPSAAALGTEIARARARVGIDLAPAASLPAAPAASLAAAPAAAAPAPADQAVPAEAAKQPKAPGDAKPGKADHGHGHGHGHGADQGDGG